MNARSCLLSSLAFAGVALGAPSAHALTFEYCDFSNVSTLTLNGNAAQLMNTLELTKNMGNQVGSAYRTAAVPWTATTSFHTYFTLQISPNAGGADGLSFILQNSGAGAAAIGRAGGALGYGNDDGTPPNINGIGNSVEVEFDTYANTWDPNANHVGIMENGANETHLAFGTPAFTMANGGTLYAWIDYAASTTTLSVYLAQTATKPAAALVTYDAVNVASIVGAQAFLGFTGGTGGSTNLQQIMEWEFSTDGVPCSCEGNSHCGAATPYCAPAGDPEAALCVACVTDAECDSNTNTATPICSKAGATTDTCVACGANTDCAATALQPVCATSGTFVGQCEMCATNTDCAGNAASPVCLAEAATNACVQCASDTNCSGTTPVCNATTHQCQACAEDSDCAAPTPACQTTGALAGECTQCSATNVTACPAGSPVCDDQTGTCVGCDTNANCAGSSPICNLATNTCRACANNTDCASISGDPVCATTGMRQGQCVVCQADTDCPANRPVCDQATSTCVGCVTSADCSGGTPICNTTTGTCLPCSADSQCAAVASTGTPLPLCQTTGSRAGECVQCTAQNSSACTTGSATPVCEVTTGLCGCTLASDCEAGQVCTGGQCVAGPVDAGSGADGSTDGGVADGGHADGGALDGGLAGDSGALADGGATGDGSTGDSGEVGDARPSTDGSVADSGVVGSEASASEDASSPDDGSSGADAEALAEAGGAGDQAGNVGGGGGCACSTPGTLAPSGAGGPMALLLVLAAVAGRRKRR
jgi:MYXO-CTERM domain-containing protein